MHKYNPLFSLTILVLCVGLIAGYGLGFYRAQTKAFSHIKPVSDINPGIATIKFLSVKNGKIHGRTDGQKARLILNAEKVLELKKGQNFSLSLNEMHLSSYYAENDVPEGALYVASKNGKYYYSIFEKSAYRLSKENRLYFSSESAAKSMGYAKRD